MQVNMTSHVRKVGREGGLMAQEQEQPELAPETRESMICLAEVVPYVVVQSMKGLGLKAKLQ